MLKDRTKGVLLMVAAWQVVPLMDGIAKYLTAYYPVVQLVWARFFFHFIIVVPVVLWRFGPRGFVTPKPGLQIMRGAFLWGATILFFWAISYLPLANAIALVFIAPILLVALAPLLLKERTTLKRWIAVATGFTAVLIIVRPGFAGFHWASLLALGTAVSFSLYLLSTRLLSGTAPALVTLAYQSVFGLVIMTAALPFFWKTPTPTHFGLMLAIGAIAATGHFLVIKAFEYADASVLAPFNYTEIVMATVVGYVFFDSFPDPWTWVGITMIVATAVYTSIPERVGGHDTDR